MLEDARRGREGRGGKRGEGRGGEGSEGRGGEGREVRGGQESEGRGENGERRRGNVHINLMPLYHTHIDMHVCSHTCTLYILYCTDKHPYNTYTEDV